MTIDRPGARSQAATSQCIDALRRLRQVCSLSHNQALRHCGLTCWLHQGCRERTSVPLAVSHQLLHRSVTDGDEIIFPPTIPQQSRTLLANLVTCTHLTASKLRAESRETNYRESSRAGLRYQWHGAYLSVVTQVWYCYLRDRTVRGLVNKRAPSKRTVCLDTD